MLWFMKNKSVQTAVYTEMMSLTCDIIEDEQEQEGKEDTKKNKNKKKDLVPLNAPKTAEIPFGIFIDINQET